MAVDAQGWLDWATPHPGPSWKQGYPGIPARPYDNIEGAVYHSAEGSYTALLNEIQHPTRQASWHFSVAKDGTTAQHYPITAICWHCGRPGDLHTETELIGNVTLVGIEHAGKVGEPLTFAQTDATVRITEDIREVTFTGTMPPELAVNLWEHNWISPITSCPSNRIPWNAIIAKLEEDTDMAKLMILRVLGQGLWEFDGVYKRAMSAPAWDLLREKYGYALDGDTVTVTREEVDAIPDAPAPLQLHLSEEDLEAIGNAAATGTANATADEIGSRLTGGN